MQLILASQSPYRRAQLEQFGVTFTALQPQVDEEALKRAGPPELKALTRFLAGEKAASLRAQYPEALLLGSDQIAEVQGMRLDKPGSRERAVLQLQQMQGQTHRLLTSIALLAPGQPAWFGSEVTELRMRPLTSTEIETYLDIDQPYDCAGSYKVEKAGLSLMESVHGRDPSAIQGLPLILLTEGLQALGFPVSQFWSRR